MNKTNGLIVLCVLTSTAVWWFATPPLIELVVFSGTNLLQGRVWTLVTSLLLHNDITHLVGNMIFLYIFGNTLENELGPRWMLFPFLIGGITSFLVSVLFYEPTVYLLGASAAIFSLSAMVMLVKPLQFSYYFFMPLGLVAILYFAYNAFAVYSGSQGDVAYLGHVVGFLIGIPFGIVSSKEWGKNLLITMGLFILYFFIMRILLQWLAS